MANTSIIHSALWLALAACYDGPPDIQLVVARTASTQNLVWKVCDANRQACRCNDKLTDRYLFGDATERERKVAIYVHGTHPSVTVALVMNVPGVVEPIDRCYHVELEDKTVVRAIDLSRSEPWCPGGGCEPAEACVFADLACTP